MDNPNCDKCTRRKHCFVKEFEVMSCEDYKPETTTESEENENNIDTPKLTN